MDVKTSREANHLRRNLSGFIPIISSRFSSSSNPLLIDIVHATVTAESTVGLATQLFRFLFNRKTQKWAVFVVANVCMDQLFKRKIWG